MRKYPRHIYTISRFLLIAIFCTGLFSCEGVSYRKGKVRDVIDPGINLTREEFEKKLLPDAKSSKNNKTSKNTSSDASEPPIPEITEILTAPRPPEIGPDKLVSISVTEDVPLKDVLIELGRLADIDMEIDPGITGGIILKATNKPFNEVMTSVVELGKLRYEYKDGVLKIKRDLPYQVDYVTDFLNIIRSSSGSVSVSTNIIGSAGGSSGGGSSTSSSGSSGSGSGSISSGSSSAITSLYEGDLWKSVEATIHNMVATESSNVSSASAANVSQSNAVGMSSQAPTRGLLTMNKQAGIISVIATQKEHKAIESYLSSVKKNISSQVLIEAKIVEVTLAKNYSAGINWGTLADQNLGVKISGNFNPTSAATAGVLSFGAERQSLSTLVGMLDTFGTSRTISSPRLHAMNNQQAVMTVAQNKVYFTVAVTDSTSTATSTTTAATTTSNITSTLHTVPIGIIMTLQPSINLESSEITMNIRPTLTTTNTVNDVPDPAVALTSQKNGATGSDIIKSSIPVIDVREMDSVMKVKSGDVMVMGGLMKSDVSDTDNGVPGVSKIPLFGNAFKSVVKTDSTIETVIFIKATIIPSDGIVARADKELYKNFTRDPRPLAF